MWSVCLVDTRDASGAPAGVDENGALRRVNRWGLVGADVRPTSTADALLRRTVTAAALSTDAPSGATGGGVRTTEVSSVPDAARNLKITGIEVEDRVVALTVEGAVPYLTYDIESGDRPSALATGWAVEKKDGGSDGRILLDAWKSGRARFYRVTRAAPK